MKKIMLTLMLIMVSSAVFAGSIDYLSNQSARFLITLAGRTASTDAADIAAYNPAGTALMGQGFFVDVSNQTLLKPYSQDVSTNYVLFNPQIDETYEQDTATWLLPNAYAVYNFGQAGIGKLAVYGQAGVVAGGGSLEWDGTAGAVAAAFSIAGKLSTTTNAGTTFLNGVDAKVKASSAYYAFGGGLAYSLLDDMVSISAGTRYNMPKRSGELSGTLDYTTAGASGGYAGLNGSWSINIDSSKYEYDATGFTYIFGLDVRPVKELTLGVRFETETDLEFKYTQKDNTITSVNATVAAGVIGGTTGLQAQLNQDDKKENHNLPQILSIAAEYVVTPDLAVSTGATIYWIGKADMEGYEDNFGTGYEISVSGIYRILDPLKIGVAVMYTNQGAKDSLLESTSTINTVSANPVLNSMMYGVGAIYAVAPEVDLTASFAWTHYISQDADITLSTGNTLSVSYSKDVYNIALGASAKI